MEVRMNQIVAVLSVIVLEVLLMLSSCDGGKKEKVAIKKKCETCKTLMDNFKQGMERTSRYMYDGGDADWEEKKLGSYTTSEMRFIEVTEQLCESKEHDCHNMLEAEEERLEEWWKEHQEDHPDIFQWFCIDNYRVCCPENTFGPDCDVCPYGLERPCKGNGKCSGAGTRGGSGKCKCHAGYKGDLCDICKDGFYQEMKNDTHTTCRACHKACTALCTGPGPIGCKKCKVGWLWSDENGCEDVDECMSEELPCEDQEYCENTEGSYKCGECDAACDRCLGEGSAHCVKCKTGHEMKNGECNDVDECEQEGSCTTDHMTCHNVPGSFYCDCSDGYERVGNECIDKEIFKANNETDQSSGESSENLESTTSREGEVDGTGSDERIVTNRGGASNEIASEGSVGSGTVMDETPNSDENTETGKGIPISRGDLNNDSTQNSENSNDRESFPRKESIQEESDSSQNKPLSQSAHEEL